MLGVDCYWDNDTQLSFHPEIQKVAGCRCICTKPNSPCSSLPAGRRWWTGWWTSCLPSMTRSTVLCPALQPTLRPSPRSSTTSSMSTGEDTFSTTVQRLSWAVFIGYPVSSLRQYRDRWGPTGSLSGHSGEEHLVQVQRGAVGPSHRGRLGQKRRGTGQ